MLYTPQLMLRACIARARRYCYIVPLAQLWQYLKTLTQKPVAPIYQAHGYAVATGVRDLADQHEHYLYGQEKRDA
jgi:hypothetical protein